MIYTIYVILISATFVVLTNFSLLFLIKNFVLYRLKIGDISILRTVNDNLKVEINSFYNSNKSYDEYNMKMYEKHVKIDKKRDELFMLSKFEFQEQFEKIKNSLIDTFSKLEKPITHCANVPSDLHGRIDILEMLEKFNLSLLTDFYGKSDDKYKQRNFSFYFNDSNFINNTNELDHYFRKLWNSRNLSLLNDSNSFDGIVGNQIELGGHWRPKNCLSRFKIGIIIPFRDSLPHLKVNLIFLHMNLQRQQLD
jgi:hypothetical protein